MVELTTRRVAKVRYKVESLDLFEAGAEETPRRSSNSETAPSQWMGRNTHVIAPARIAPVQEHGFKALHESTRLNNMLLQAQEEERSRISKELHDDLGQALVAIRLQLGYIERNLDKTQSNLKRCCAELFEYLDHTVESVRRLSHGLSPHILENLGLAAALRWLLKSVEKDHYIEVEIEKDLDQIFPKEVQVSIYRIFQEALTNIVKHARASRVSILIRKESEEVSFIIEDNGKGISKKEPLERMSAENGLGLYTMSRRASMWDGSLTIRSGREGTRIVFSIPIHRRGCE
jgi:signal transduction histidine kinase